MTITDAQKRVEREGGTLSTLREDGSRKWLRPRVSPGRFLSRRRAFAWLLIIIFTAIPYIRINGKPSILLDITRREFTFFGKTFLPTDTLLLALFIVSVFVSIFLMTALLGRVWCGWACPQTVYMEFLYRPLERLFTGAPGRKKNRLQSSSWGPILKFISYVIVSLFLAHTFLAYFVGIDRLVTWIGRSPLDHPTSFLVIVIVTALILFDFGFFREQLCIVACPYGRFQSVMLDRNSLIISYDPNRGEPRGRMRRARKTAPTPVDLTVSAPPKEPEPGDCIDCKMCVVTCPTGIDIRDGLQLECIGCAQCIDACDAVMDKIDRPRGLIRYSTQEAIDGKKTHLIRPRVVLYPLLLTVAVTAFIVVLVGKKPIDMTILREQGLPYVATGDGSMITNNIKIKLVNRLPHRQSFRITILGDSGATFVGSPDNAVTLEADPRVPVTLGVAISTPRGAFAPGGGQLTITLHVEGEGVSKEQSYRLLGPRGAANPG
ncbi:MAG: cytochrome c oxidase accessory protein CcoG [Phycisphaeraceae bacterium]|nr:cytochrome c oxidase accessory protein CcoG [Phycisphaeraceae bacterium]